MSLELIIRSILLGAGLAMDAFSVSLADGLSEQNMRKSRMLAIAGTFAMFQFAMPMIGWVLVKTAVERFAALEIFIPWIALLLLLYIGGKMLIEGIRERRAMQESGVEDDTERRPDAAHENGSESDLSAGHAEGTLTFAGLMLQGIATSIDALSVGFTIETYGLHLAFASSLIIGVVTLAICLAGLDLGRRIGTRLAGRSSIFGGVILILIGIEIWAKGVFF